MHYGSLVEVGEPRVLFRLIVIFSVCCVYVLSSTVRLYVRSVVSRGKVSTEQVHLKYFLVNALIYLGIIVICHG